MGLPVYDEDLFSEDGIRDPYPHYRAVRDLGPVVWLAATGVHAVTRYDDVRAVLADDRTFVSGQGVLFGDLANELTRGTTLASDNPLHQRLRSLVAHRLTPRALRGRGDQIDQQAADLVAGLVDPAVADGAVVVDAVADLARAMPLSVVPDFIGFPEDCRDRLLDWASGAIEAGGPPGPRTPPAVALARELGEYAGLLTARGGLEPDSLGADLLAATDRGEIDRQQCTALLLDYFGPSLETTISAIGSALALFAAHPDQWDRLRANPDLVAGAFNETLRLESPLRAFTRVAAVDAEIGGAPVAAGTRVAVFYASANRDERVWERPDEFDIGRVNGHQLGLGYGVHGCAGQGLARLEFAAVMTRLAERVQRLEPVGEPVRTLNSMLRAWSSFPLRLQLAPAPASV